MQPNESSRPHARANKSRYPLLLRVLRAFATLPLQILVIGANTLQLVLFFLHFVRVLLVESARSRIRRVELAAHVGKLRVHFGGVLSKPRDFGDIALTASLALVAKTRRDWRLRASGHDRAHLISSIRRFNSAIRSLASSAFCSSCILTYVAFSYCSMTRLIESRAIRSVSIALRSCCFCNRKASVQSGCSPSSAWRGAYAKHGGRLLNERLDVSNPPQLVAEKLGHYGARVVAHLVNLSMQMRVVRLHASYRLLQTAHLIASVGELKTKMLLQRAIFLNR